jgi:putative alpha-1,2-mannosidase
MNHRCVLLLLVAMSGSALGAIDRHSKDPVDYVSPNIGGIGQLLTATIPYVQCPHGMARLAPVTTPGITDRYLADKIYGFPAGPAMLMASVGKADTHAASYASEYDHGFETATPYYYAAELQSWGIRAEFTATREAAYYRFTLPTGDHTHLVLSMRRGAELEVVSSTAVQGSQRVGGRAGRIADTDTETREYFYAEFSRPLGQYSTWRGDDLSHEAKQSGDSIGFITDRKL